MLRPTKDELMQYKAYYASDTAFSAYARLLQSKWRHLKGYDDDKDRLGNYLETDFAKRTKANFLTDNIKELVTQEVHDAKKQKKLISEPRIWDNLLSSQPLCFNLFGELKFDKNKNLATDFFHALFPERVDEVIDIKFEHSEWRGIESYLGDNSAFDVFVEYTKDNRKGFIGIEVKYAESLHEESSKTAERNFNRHKRYTEVSESSGVFKPNSIDNLRQPPQSQIWRDHLLALSVLQNKDYDEGFFVFLFPSLNQQCQRAVDHYKQFLTSDDEKQTAFYARYLEDFIRILNYLSHSSWAKELSVRYLGDIESRQTRYCAQHSPMTNPKRVAINMQFSQQQFYKLIRGIESDWDGKWFAYYEDGWLYFHRSWTGRGIFKSKLTRQSDGYAMKEFFVEQDTYRDDKGNVDEDKCREMITFLIKIMMLGAGN